MNGIIEPRQPADMVFNKLSDLIAAHNAGCAELAKATAAPELIMTGKPEVEDPFANLILPPGVKRKAKPPAEEKVPEIVQAPFAVTINLTDEGQLAVHTDILSLLALRGEMEKRGIKTTAITGQDFLLIEDFRTPSFSTAFERSLKGLRAQFHIPEVAAGKAASQSI